MRNILIPCSIVGVALLWSMAGADAATKVPICHYDGSVYRLTQVPLQTRPAHLAHGDVDPSTWWPDADADGHGDPAGATIPCPRSGYAQSDDDCNDADADVSPSERDTCKDDIDNDCSGVIDQLCTPSPADACPCFGIERMRETDEDWARLDFPMHEQQCVDFDDESREHPGTQEQILEITFMNYTYSDDPYEPGERDRFVLFTADWREGYQYCHGVSSWNELRADGTLGGAIYYDWWEWLDDNEVASCRQLIEGFADELGLVCRTERETE